VTWAELRRDAEVQLRAGGIEQPGVEVGWMLEEVSGLDAAEQVTEARSPATRRAAGALDGLVARRLAGEPLQYVLGSWSFRGIDLLVDRRVLIPRPETEIVAQVAIDEVAATGERVGPPDAWRADATTYTVADLGTGSGALALALAFALPEAAVWATELDPDALAVARANVAGAGTPAARVRISEGSWFAALPDELRGALRLVVANPPYIAEHEVGDLPDAVAGWEPRRALVSGPTGLEAIDVIVREAPGWLEARGVLVLELAPHQAAVVADLARDEGFAAVEVKPDLTGRDRVLVARRSLG
jgi:release factor glutamine methyltransferase